MRKTLIKSWTKKDFKIDWFSGTGAGGQHRNKHQNCVRVTHIESGLMTIGQNSRSRTQNFKEAFNELGVKLKEHYYPDTVKERAPNTDVVRTYNIPDNRVVDHSSGHKEAYNGMDVDEFITKRLTYRESPDS